MSEDLVPRDAGGRFAPGSRANPGGRPKAVAEVRDLARQHTEAAVEGLLEIAQNPRMAALARVRAWEVILDRAWGRPAQSVDVSGASQVLAFQLVAGDAPREIERGDDG